MGAAGSGLLLRAGVGGGATKDGTLHLPALSPALEEGLQFGIELVGAMLGEIVSAILPEDYPVPLNEGYDFGVVVKSILKSFVTELRY